MIVHTFIFPVTKPLKHVTSTICAMALEEVLNLHKYDDLDTATANEIEYIRGAMIECVRMCPALLFYASVKCKFDRHRTMFIITD